MDVTDTLRLDVCEQSQISDARRRIVNFSIDCGLDQEARDRLALVVTELGTNLVKHSQNGGRILAQGMVNANGSAIEVFSVDRGPGMNVGQCMLDGFSTTETFGNGLGSAKRNSNDFDVYSEIGKGSVIKVRFENKGSKLDKFEGGGISVPMPGELLSGDKWFIASLPEGCACLLVDGLGHGFEASEAATLARKRFKENLNLPPKELLKVIHTSLRGTRGAVGAIAKIDFAKGKLTYCGLGNITGLLFFNDTKKYLTSFNGTLGYEARKFLEVEVDWNADSMLMMCSDGISSTTFRELGEASHRSASLLAAWIYSNYGKSTDDATVLILKGRG